MPTKRRTVERPDIPNVLNREFAVASPDQVWCGPGAPPSKAGEKFSYPPNDVLLGDRSAILTLGLPIRRERPCACPAS